MNCLSNLVVQKYALDSGISPLIACLLHAGQGNDDSEMKLT